MLPLVDWTKPVVMDDGRPVRVLCTDRKFLHDERMAVVILIDDPTQGDLLASCMADGRLFDNPHLKLRVVNREDANV